jgi:hypothetical protein
MQHDLQKIIAELVSFGENAEELSLIAELFDALDETAQKAMLENLVRERDTLAK